MCFRPSVLGGERFGLQSEKAVARGQQPFEIPICELALIKWS